MRKTFLYWYKATGKERKLKQLYKYTFFYHGRKTFYFAILLQQCYEYFIKVVELWRAYSLNCTLKIYLLLRKKA